MNYYKIINNKKGKSYIFNKDCISLMEQKRLSLFLTQKQFAEYYKIPLRNYQRVIASEKVGRKIAHFIINKLLKKHTKIHSSNYDKYEDLDKEIAYLEGLSDGLETR